MCLIGMMGLAKSPPAWAVEFTNAFASATRAAVARAEIAGVPIVGHDIPEKKPTRRAKAPSRAKPVASNSNLGKATKATKVKKSAGGRVVAKKPSAAKSKRA
jgi:hypothetical protein